MKNFLKQAVFAAAVASAPATQGCRIPQFPDTPVKIAHGPHGPVESPASEKSLQELLALCREQHKEVSECLEENDELGIKMVHQHLADLPALEDGKIPEEWTQTREEALQRIKMEETIFRSMSGIKVELNEQQNVIVIHVEDDKHFIFEKPLPVEFFPLAENEIRKFLEILSDRKSLKSSGTFKMHDVNMIEFEAIGDDGRNKTFGYLPVPDHVVGELKQNQAGTDLQALGPLPISSNQKQQLEVTDIMKGKVRKIFTSASPVMRITSHFDDDREEKEDEYLLPDGTTIRTLSARSKSGVTKQYYDAQGERELHSDRWTPIRVTVESDFYKHFDLNDNGQITTIRTEDPDLRRKVVSVDPATEKPVFEKALEKDSGCMIAEDGTRIGAYHQEKKRNPNLTPDDYLNRLAKYVTSPSQWLGLTHLMRAVKPQKEFHDLKSDAEKAQWTKAREGQWWQSVQQGMEQRDYPADPADYALLGQEILKRQGIRSQVVYMPFNDYGYLAVWMTRRPDNNFDVNYYNGEIGKNGIFYSAETAESFRAAKGVKNVQEIAAAACKIFGPEKIEEIYDVDCTNQKLLEFFLQFWDGNIPALQLPIKSERDFTGVPFENLFN